MLEIRELPEGARQPLAESELTLEQLAEGLQMQRINGKSFAVTAE